MRALTVAQLDLPNSEENLGEKVAGTAYSSCLSLHQQDVMVQLSLSLLPAAVQALFLPEVCCRFKTKLGQGRAWVGRVEKAEQSPHSPPLRES